jgi:hypothetical protein
LIGNVDETLVGRAIGGMKMHPSLEWSTKVERARNVCDDTFATRLLSVMLRDNSAVKATSFD